MNIDKNKVEEILKKLWKEDDGFVSIERISYNKALQDIQYEIDKLEIKENTTNFSEIKESEDEKIRKTLIDLVKCNERSGYASFNSVSTSSIRKWFKKQGKQKSKKVSTWKHWKDGIAGNGEGKPIYLTKVGNTYSLTSCLGFECDYIELSELDKLLSEKQGEQNHNGKKWIYEDVYLKEREQLYQDGINEVLENPQKYGFEKSADNTNKVEPKFKAGDWVSTDGGFSVLLIKNVDAANNKYEISWSHGGKGFPNIDFIDSDCHLWTIKDARDGAVLASDSSVFIFKEEYLAGKPTAYCGIMNGQFIQVQNGCWTNELCHPASDEEHVLLFQKMKDEGYRFDFMNKELKPLSKPSIE